VRKLNGAAKRLLRNRGGKIVATDDMIKRLADHRTVGNVPRSELEWLAAHGTPVRYEKGHIVLHLGEVVESMIVMFSGKLSIYVPVGGAQLRIMEWGPGDVTGNLPYSRLTTAPGDTHVEETIEGLALPRSEFPGLILHCHEITSHLVHVMLDRARRFTSADLRNEKMFSLGKLAAGLAHELNNPASAAMRDAKALTEALTMTENAARALSSGGLSEAQLADIYNLKSLCATAMGSPVSGLALADREEEISSWLAVHGTDTAVSAELARIGITDQTLNHLASILSQEMLGPALGWIATGCTARLLAANIELAATRIHSLVSAVKGFTHMDRAPDIGPVNISAGLADTISLLGGKAKNKSIKITLTSDPGLPPAYGLSAEINQIWMNIIDNAIDAAPNNGHVIVTASHDDHTVVVRINDDGPGIPKEDIGSIFDPFFTTKSIGEGTGLGLDIVRRIITWHNGEIDVTSRPGKTVFQVKLPAYAG
jgi:signal transduction histidine kinase